MPRTSRCGDEIRLAGCWGYHCCFPWLGSARNHLSMRAEILMAHNLKSLETCVLSRAGLLAPASPVPTGSESFRQTIIAIAWCVQR